MTDFCGVSGRDRTCERYRHGQQPSPQRSVMLLRMPVTITVISFDTQCNVKQFCLDAHEEISCAVLENTEISDFLSE